MRMLHRLLKRVMPPKKMIIEWMILVVEVKEGLRR